jgi:alkylation response protein AidB-like acyl-CoA dehydrogenase
VDLELGDDQQLFVDTARKFIGANMPMTAVRALHDSETGFDADVWREAAELGWTALLVPEDLGGGSVSDSGLLDLVLVAEELGRAAGAAPLLPVNVVADTLGRVGNDEQRKLVDGLLSGDVIATWAFDDGDDRWDAGSVSLSAKKDGAEWVLDGAKSYVQDAGVSDWFLVTANSGKGLTQFLVDREAPGVTVEALGSLDLTRKYGALTFADVRLPASAVVGAEGDAAADVERQYQVALVIQNAETVGATTKVFEFTLEYTKDRMAFGRPIGSYQALKHRMADMKSWIEASHATATASAKAVAAGAPDAAELVRVAKAYIADRSPAIIQDCVQLHGGIGVTWEHDLHVYLRRVTQNCAIFGSARHQREAIASMIGMDESA